RVFLYEYCCATASGSPITSGLHREGWAMLSALLQDFVAIPEAKVVTLLQADLPALPGIECRRIGPESERAAFHSLCRQADYTLVIAPEFDGLLAERCRWVAETGGRSLGSSLPAVLLAADKLELGRRLLKAQVPIPFAE